MARRLLPLPPVGWFALLIVALLALGGAHVLGGARASGGLRSAPAAPPVPAPAASPPSATPARASAPAASPVPQTALADEMDQILRTQRTGPVFWGLYVRDLSTGRTLYDTNGNTPFVPASNQKLFTTAAALDAMGSTHRFQTTLAFDGRTRGSVMRGDLVLRGAGDPSFGSAEMGPDPLRRWAQELAAMGVTRIEGRLIGDDDVFDDRPYPEGWDVDYLTRQASRSIGISTGGLPYRDNVVSVRVRSTRPGYRARVSTLPANIVEVDNQTVTSSRRRGSSLHILRTFKTNALVLDGSVPRRYRGTRDIPVSNPTTFALACFAEYLRDAGIETRLELVDIDDLDREPPTELPPLFVHLSPPLADLVAIINKKSNNFYAEHVFRAFGYDGSARGAERRMKTFLRRVGADASTLQHAVSVNDGSGLSRKDMTTPRVVVDLLDYMDRHGEREAFVASLARGGEPGTTLKHRLRGVRVRAKTGSLKSVRALSGYVERPDGRRLAFSFIANHYGGPSYRVTQTLDRLTRALARATIS